MPSVPFLLFRFHGLGSRNLQYVMRYTPPAQRSPRCGCPPVDRSSVLSYRKPGILSIVYPVPHTGHWDLCTTVAFHAMVVAASFSFVLRRQLGHSLRTTMTWFRLCVVFSFLLWSVLIFSLPRCFVPPSCRVSRVTLSSSYHFCAPIWFNLKTLACRPKATGYAQLSKCRIHAFSSYWTVQ